MSKKEKYLIKLVMLVFLFIIISTLFGCKSKIKTVEVRSTDTIYKTEIVKVSEPVFNEVFIESPCDSLGNLKPINIVTQTPKAKVTLKSVKNNLKLEVDIDSIVDSRVNEFKSSYKKEKQIITEYKTPGWIKKVLKISLLLNLLGTGWIFRSPLLRIIKNIF